MFLRIDITKYKLPDKPGVYYFLGSSKLGKTTKDARGVLYIGKATSLKDRVRSYFNGDLGETRGPKIEQMLLQAADLKWQETDSVLEALILEAELIKKHQPPYNTREKDDKSYWYVVITKEDYPRVLMRRGRELEKDLPRKYEIEKTFGPFPFSSELKAALKIVRRIFPYRDTCLLYSEKNKGLKVPGLRGCFNSQIGLCPGVCTGAIDKKTYRQIIKNLGLFFEGKKEQVVKNLEKEMKIAVKAQNFEEAARWRDQIFALKHIQDVSLLKNTKTENFLFEAGAELVNRRNGKEKTVFRLEAYDVAHLAGAGTVGAMAVWEGRELNKSEYRLFKLRGRSANKSDDTGNLAEILRRRFTHREWRLPDLVVVDGGQAQFNAAQKTLNQLNLSLPLVAVVKDEKHRPREILGEKTMAKNHRRKILAVNADVHRFVLAYHRKILRQMLK